MTLPLIEQYIGQHPKVVAHVIEKYDIASQAALLNQVPTPCIVGLLPHLSAYNAGKIILSFDTEKALELLQSLPVALSRRLLQSMPELDQQSLLQQLPSKISHLIKLMLKHPDNSVGSIMNPQVVTVREKMSVKGVKNLLVNNEVSIPHTIFILDGDNAPIAFISLKDLIIQPEKKPVESFCQAVSTKLFARKSILSTVNIPDWEEVDSLPVVNSQNIFVGELTHQTIYKALETIEMVRPNTTIAVDIINTITELFQEFTVVKRID